MIGRASVRTASALIAISRLVLICFVHADLRSRLGLPRPTQLLHGRFLPSGAVPSVRSSSSVGIGQTPALTAGVSTMIFHSAWICLGCFRTLPSFLASLALLSTLRH